MGLVHTRMSALGWVVGGSGTVVQALLEALGPDGTLMAYAGWDHDSYDIETWPGDRRAAYEADPPAYDPTTSEATRDNGHVKVDAPDLTYVSTASKQGA